ncbi:PREDICTED: tubulin polyglutamylase TTLL13 isoform X1 [Rhagoletis zephyria]|uniref:tubulin polyglutamylase TTLL13 isoform X1 n=1 Tax=Rhagoletis zephyria TaxID=28612 RepID=UPI0008119A3A|nr:PREDICTED: tubulin polyglutamylase TTLL13 isoform X1 [Rhagoletis zephyria]
MNLKNSKFFKRIQELRRLSKEKLRMEKNRGTRIDVVLENALKERNGHCVRKSNNDAEEKEERKEYHNTHELTAESEAISDGLIQLNNVCFRLKCGNTPKSSLAARDDMPIIPKIKGSICVSNSRFSIIGRVSKALGFKLVKEGKLWNILWTDSLPGVELYKSMKRFQQINHYPDMMEICRKDLLSRNLNRMLKLFPRDYKIFPKTWIFPADYGDAINYANNNNFKSKPATFIIKPDSGAMGRGIWLTNDLKSINPSERMICQTYINKPLLIDGYKFDLRVYTLITSVDPLRIFVYNEGLARFATNKYVEPTTENSCDLFMHLTNYSVNKRSSQYDLCDNDDCGSKRKFSAINNWLRRHNHDVDGFWANIDDIIIKTVLSAWPMLKHNYHACFPTHDKIQACFEILGFDILVDSKLKPYVLEVNHSPSYHTHELVDRQVKKALIRDTLLMVSTPLADKKQILREDRKRIKQRLLKLKQCDTRILNSNPRQTTPIDFNNASASADNESSPQEDASQDAGLSALSQQIAWEESHLGDFRRIMPPQDPERLNYYCQFYALQNQASIYSETAASKKREEVAKKLRLEIEKRRQHQLEVLSGQRRHMKLQERRRKRALTERHRLTRYRAQENWTPGFISEAEERLRRTWMQMRSEMLRNNKIVQMIYQDFYNGGNLTNADIVIYPELYRCLERGADIMSDN